MPTGPLHARLRKGAAQRPSADGDGARALDVQRFLQPDDVTCGPTCLRQVYDFYGFSIEMDDIVDALERNEDGGTLAVYLAMAALRRGLKSRLYTYDLQIFDPTWAKLPAGELIEKVRARLAHLRDPKRRGAAVAYVRYLQMGGEITFEDLTPSLIKAIIDRGHPVLAGLSATYLYGFERERWDEATGRLVIDDIAGDPVGHFVVISGYDEWGSRLTVLDPFEHVPASEDGRVIVNADRLINAIMLGDVTYDAVLLELWPQEQEIAPLEP